MDKLACLACGKNEWIMSFSREDHFVHLMCSCGDGAVGVSRNYLADDGITVRETNYIQQVDGSYKSVKQVTRTF